MTTLKLVKTDGRHAGHDYFTHYAELSLQNKLISNIERFTEMRVWCWDQWGPSTERDFYAVIDRIDSGWAWHLFGPTLRIYFESEEKASWFMLKWG